jgi:hypothetical protein
LFAEAALRVWLSIIPMLAIACRSTDAPAPTSRPSEPVKLRERIGPPPRPTQTYTAPLPSLDAIPPIESGPLPLAYVFSGSDQLTVTDETTGAILARSWLEGRQLVRVDAKRGVIAGEKVLAAGPLDPKHRYGIRLGVARAGEFKNTRGGSNDARPPENSLPEEKR